MTRKMIIVRHGETEHNAAGRTISATDPPLNDVGIRQVIRTAKLIGEVRLSRIICSPRLRTKQTAHAIGSAQIGVVPIEYDDRLLEIGLGGFEGLTNLEIIDRGLGAVFAGWRQGLPPQYPVGAETFEEAADRVSGLYDDACPSGDDAVCIVGHSHLLRILVATKVMGVHADAHRRLKIDHASITTVEWEGATPRLVMLNLCPWE